MRSSLFTENSNFKFFTLAFIVANVSSGVSFGSVEDGQIAAAVFPV